LFILTREKKKERERSQLILFASEREYVHRDRPAGPVAMGLRREGKKKKKKIGGKSVINKGGVEKTPK